MDGYISKISDFLDSKLDEMILELQKLVSFPSYNAAPVAGMPYGENAAKCLNAALELCDKLGFQTKNFENYVGTATMGDDPKLGILCHLDVVPEGDGWKHSPYGTDVEDGKIFGRGTIDDKGPAIAALYAMYAVKSLGISLKSGVRCILGTNEECGSHDLEYYKTKEDFPEMVFTPDGSYPLINIEKGQAQCEFTADYTDTLEKPYVISVHSGHTINAVPSSATALISGFTAKDVVQYVMKLDAGVSATVYEKDGIVEIKTSGKSAHASTPEIGKNALTALLAMLTSMPFAESQGFDYLKKISKMLPYGDTCGKEIGVFSSDEKSGDLTLAFSIFSYEGGKLSGKFDIRFPLCTTTTTLKETLMAVFAEELFNINFLSLCSPHETPADTDFVKKLLSVYKLETGEDGIPLAIGGGTYVHNIPGGVAFGAEFPGDSNNMHTSEEFIQISSLLKNAKIFAHSILKLCS